MSWLACVTAFSVSVLPSVPGFRASIAAPSLMGLVFVTVDGQAILEVVEEAIFGTSCSSLEGSHNCEAESSSRQLEHGAALSRAHISQC